MEKTQEYAAGADFPWRYKYPHMAVTTDCVIFTYEDRHLKVLLVRRGAEPYKGAWAFPGGFLQMDEDARTGALRELREETGLRSAAISELGVFSAVDRDPRERVITIAWYALVKPSAVAGGDDADEAAWFPVEDLPELAFDHKQIFSAAMQRLRRDIHFEPVGFNLLDDDFTLPDLQRLYETILGTTFDRRNFQRKILASGILEKAEPEPVRRESDPVLCEPESVIMNCIEDSCADDPVPVCCEAEPAPVRREAKPARVRWDAKPQSKACAPEPGLLASRSEPVRRRKEPGRTPFLFRFNRKRYDEMKEKGESEF